MDAGRWLAQERGSLEVEEVRQFEAVPPVMYPLAERIPPDQLVILFAFRETLPCALRMRNGLPTEASSPLN